MKLIFNTIVVLIFICLISINTYPLVEANEDVDLAHLMANLQYFLHKTGLSITATDPRLVEFYIHELDESIEEIEGINNYEGYPIGELTKAMLLPSFEIFKKSIKKIDVKAVHSAYLNLIQACNNCHAATKHEFIKITHNESNPFLQTFD